MFFSLPTHQICDSSSSSSSSPLNLLLLLLTFTPLPAAIHLPPSLLRSPATTNINLFSPSPSSLLYPRRNIRLNRFLF
ncbi:hypothetical protein QL285_045982 [Trifolium repens]|nr:hypothetical protein QL285_045982 [Trifolium repens]